ncbi:MAG: thiamine-phosphate kinase [Armatimonadetes bacterium]|nr:thiamine-phosphate kinase [Armatimonadota bacterium]
MREVDLIKRFASLFPAADLSDDAAIIPFSDTNLILTMDMLLEGIHFDRRWCDAYSIGWKAATASLSDLAAMRAKPLALGWSVGIRPDDTEWTLEAARGLADCCARFGCPVVGGDTNRSDCAAIDVVALGTSDHPSRRSTAQAGDALLVSGPLGASLTGLLDLRKHGRTASLTPIHEAHLRPIPRLDFARHETAVHWSAAMDISDGLSADLPKLCAASGLGAQVEPESVPVHPGAKEYALQNDLDPLMIALQGGEDYELLVASSNPDPLIAAGWIRIGQLTSDHGIDWGGVNPPEGYDHFG